MAQPSDLAAVKCSSCSAFHGQRLHRVKVDLRRWIPENAVSFDPTVHHRRVEVVDLTKHDRCAVCRKYPDGRAERSPAEPGRRKRGR